MKTKKRSITSKTTLVIPNTWTTIATLLTTLGHHIDLVSVRADAADNQNFNYRIQLLLDGTVVFEETIATSAPSEADVPKQIGNGQELQMQVQHAELTARSLRGTIFYEE